MNVLSGRLQICFFRRFPKAAAWLCLAAALALAGCWAVSPALGATAKGVALRPLTGDGKSSFANGGAGCSPQGNLVAYYKEVGEETFELRVLDLDSGESSSVSSVGFPAAATWSRDGSKLAYIFANSRESTSEGTVMVWDAASGRTSRTAMRERLGRFIVEWDYFYPRWSPDNKHLAIQTTGEDGSLRLFVFPAEGGSFEQVAPNNRANLLTEIRPPNVWDADGSRLAFINWESNQLGQIWTANAAGKGLKRISDDYPNLWGLAWSWGGDNIAFTTSKGRSQEERDMGLADIWIIGADGSAPRAVASGAGAALEERATWRLFDWTQDDRYIIAWMEEYDERGDIRYRGIDLVAPDSGEILHALYFETQTSEELSINPLSGWRDSPDSGYLAMVGTQYTVYGPREDPRREDPRSIIKLFSVADDSSEDIVTYNIEQDRYYFSGNISWTADSRALVVPRVRDLGASARECDLFLVALPRPPAPEAGAAPQQPEAPPERVGEAVCVGLVELPILNRRAQEVADLLPGAHKNTFTVDENRNALIIAADAENLASLQECIKALDTDVPHIMVNVMVTELTKDANRQLGLDWEFARSRFGGTLPFSDTTAAGSVFWEGVGQLDEEFYAELSMLSEHGKATVRANPRVLAASGKEANITIRRTDFFLFQSGVDYYGNPYLQRSDISADTILKITPILLGDGRINVKVDATVDSFTFGGRDDLPDTTRRQAVTEVSCHSGESIIIGGLTQQDVSKSVHKTPLLGDIPVLGQLFRHTSVQSRESTLVMFITPRVAAGMEPQDRATLTEATGPWMVETEVKDAH